MSLRLRIFLAFALLAILPTLPVTWAVRDLLDRSFSVGLSEEFASGLEAGAESARGWLRAERAAFRGDCERIADGELTTFATPANGGEPDLPDGFEAAILTGDSPSTLIGTWLPAEDLCDRARELAPRGASAPAAPYWLDRANRNRLTALLPLGNPVDSWLFLSRPLPPGLAAAFNRIVEARQLQAGLILERDTLRRGFLLPFLLVYLLVLALSLAVAGLLSRRLTQRLELLAAGARRVGGGDWSARVKLRGRDEIARLGEAFNDMAAGLGDQQRRLADLERMAAWREMARSLAHEIKNPLTPISLMVQEMSDRYPGDDAEHKAFLSESGRIIEEEIESLRRLSREFSDFARTPEMQRSRSDLGALLEDLTRLYGSVPIRLRLDPELAHFDFDPEQLRRVFSNLFENSLAAMAELPEAERGIDLSVVPAGDHVRVDFRDRGPGVPDEIAARIFEPHFSTKGGGMGLGLALVRSVCTLHGGDARLENGEGGAHFVIELPLTTTEESP